MYRPCWQLWRTSHMCLFSSPIRGQSHHSYVRLKPDISCSARIAHSRCQTYVPEAEISPIRIEPPTPPQQVDGRSIDIRMTHHIYQLEFTSPATIYFPLSENETLTKDLLPLVLKNRTCLLVLGR